MAFTQSQGTPKIVYNSVHRCNNKMDYSDYSITQIIQYLPYHPKSPGNSDFYLQPKLCEQTERWAAILRTRLNTFSGRPSPSITFLHTKILPGSYHCKLCSILTVLTQNKG